MRDANAVPRYTHRIGSGLSGLLSVLRMGDGRCAQRNWPTVVVPESSRVEMNDGEEEGEKKEEEGREGGIEGGTLRERWR